MAYTGVCMLSGDKFQIFHKYVEDIMGRPVYTHEMAIKAVDDEIKEKAKADFIALCAEQEPFDEIIDKTVKEIYVQCKQTNSNFSKDWNEGFNDGMFHAITIIKGIRKGVIE